ncbi:hypothetical protein [Pantoea sp. SO10]|uniref:hypothetical protein n=1 Tax=Pantoea sp. SO10 TaxID=2575375 RepID=UPI001FEF7285|nr:hypothetical protein [Pantoea sp. SO10]
MDFGVGCFAGKLSYRIDYNDKLQEAVIMEKRVSKLEADIHEMKMDIAVIKSNYVTKSDLYQEIGKVHQDIGRIHQELSKQTKWIVAGMLSTAGMTLALARWLF